MMKFFDDRCAINMWGYNSVDQVLLPFFLYPSIAIAGCLWTLICGREETDVERASRLPFTRFESGSVASINDGWDEEDVSSRLEEHFARDVHDVKDSEPFHKAIMRTAREDCGGCFAGLAWMFLYRLLINIRAIGYTYLVARYDLNSAYLELTLVRVVMSWLGSLVLVLGAPRFIGASADEQQEVKSPASLVLKVFGSAAITTTLVLLNVHAS